jgi:NitT/TauT family transport system ATP-binding protein
MIETLIRVKGVSKIYQTISGETVKALEKVSFKVPQGSFIAVVGPSGCGKSTLLKILAGILSKSEGEVILHNAHVEGPRHDIGIVFQDPTLLPWRTVIENVMLPAQVQGLNRGKYNREPFGALDAMTREYMNLELLRIWQSSEKTIFFITHSISESVFLSDEVIVLSARPGRIEDCVSVNLPRPRQLAMMATPEFNRLTESIRSRFDINEILNNDKP